METLYRLPELCNNQIEQAKSSLTSFPPTDSNLDLDLDSAVALDLIQASSPPSETSTSPSALVCETLQRLSLGCTVNLISNDYHYFQVVDPDPDSDSDSDSDSDPNNEESIDDYILWDEVILHPMKESHISFRLPHQS